MQFLSILLTSYVGGLLPFLKVSTETWPACMQVQRRNETMTDRTLKPALGFTEEEWKTRGKTIKKRYYLGGPLYQGQPAINPLPQRQKGFIGVLSDTGRKTIRAANESGPAKPGPGE